MSEFSYKDIDLEGWETLDVISKAHRFNAWMYETIKPFCHGRILEIGSGIGNISALFVRDKSDLTLSDIRENYCQLLRQKFPDNAVLQINLTDADFDTINANNLGRFDTVFALNVVEHIYDDEVAIRNCYKLLARNGTCVILVPAFQTLYNRFDKELEHYRRYTKKTLNNLMRKGGFELKHHQYFNLMGIPGWYVSGKLQGNKTIPKDQMSLYNAMVPIFKLMDKCAFNAVGLSVVSVGVKQ